MAEAEKTPHFATPSTVERLFGRVLMALVRIGVVRGHFYVLEVRGRRSGKIFSVPVDPLDLDGHRYLVCPRGESNWVRNARTAGDVTLVRALRRWRYRVHEIPPEQRAPILKAYLDSFAAEVQRFFPIPKGTAPEDFVAIAPRYPVFELQLWT